MDVLRRQLSRFVLVGGLNTAVTYLSLALLAQVIDARLAYTLVFVAGLVFTSFMTSRFVFSARSSRRRMLIFVLLYISIFAVGLLVIDSLESGGQRSTFSLALVTIGVTGPLSFLGGRLVFYERPDPLHGKGRK